MSATIMIYAPTVVDVANWAKEQQTNLLHCELHLNFKTGEIELYDYERGVTINKVSLCYFEQT